MLDKLSSVYIERTHGKSCMTALTRKKEGNNLIILTNCELQINVVFLFYAFFNFLSLLFQCFCYVNQNREDCLPRDKLGIPSGVSC